MLDAECLQPRTNLLLQKHANVFKHLVSTRVALSCIRENILTGTFRTYNKAMIAGLEAVNEVFNKAVDGELDLGTMIIKHKSEKGLGVK
jgi:hypothetical protein